MFSRHGRGFSNYDSRTQFIAHHSLQVRLLFMMGEAPGCCIIKPVAGAATVITVKTRWNERDESRDEADVCPGRDNGLSQETGERG